MTRRVSAASIFLASQVKADISQAGTLRMQGRRSKKGRFRAGTIYNFTHSRPGNPPYKQTGRLRGSIARELVGLKGRIGTNMPVGLWLETGTKHMAKRPYLTRNLRVHSGTLARILTARIRPGELDTVRSNQFRSGHFGKGAASAGYA